ncbi:MAG TPA: hypothetical protein VEB18_04120 [Candidatus Paceibacterota bacterium]|nr:hypothetical protein [Candidatus Paceibacterota bacterium]
MRLPSRAITYLSFSCAALVVAYLALVATTIFFATLRTDRMVSLRELESKVSALETEYYDAIAHLSATDVIAQGYVTPTSVEYVMSSGAPAVTRAGR